MKKSQLNLYFIFFVILLIPIYLMVFAPLLQEVGSDYIINNGVIGLEALFFDYLGFFVFLFMMLAILVVGVFSR